MPEACTSKRGRESKEVRWTVEHAATEFGLDRRTLAKRIRTAGIPAWGDGKFSTQDILRALYGDDPGKEKDREQAEHFRLKNQELRHERVPVQDAEEVWDATFQAIAGTLKSHKGKLLTQEVINAIFRLIREAKLPC